MPFMTDIGRHGPARESGFSLIEIMIALAISLVIAAALLTLLSNNSRTATELDRASRQIENGRFALDILTRELQMAGYYAELNTTGAAFSTPNPCQTALANLGFIVAPLTVPAALQGTQGTAGDPAPACAPSPQPNTAALVVRRLAGVATPLTGLAANTAYVQTSRCSTDPATTPFVLGDSATAYPLLDFACAAAMPVRAYLSTIFYVATCSQCAGGGADTIPTLKRVDCTIAGCQTVTALAEGIEELQVEYGFDTNADGTPDEFRTTLDGAVGSAANDWSNVMSVRLWVVSRATEATLGYTDTKTYDLGTLFGTRGPYNDAFKRRVYSTLVRLNNPAGWRE